MNTQDNAKVMEALEKQTMHNYFEKIINAKMHKVVLFSIFPHTAAANLSDPRYFVLIDELAKIASLNAGSFNN